MAARHKAKKREGHAKHRFGVFIFFKRFYKAIAVIVGVIFFFIGYNTYLVDRSMEDIQFALEAAAMAESVNDVEGVDMVLLSSITEQVAPMHIDSGSLANLDMANNIIAKADVLQQMKDAKFLLEEVLDKKKQKRGAVLLVLDRVNNGIKQAFDNTKSFLSLPAKEIEFIEPDSEIVEVAESLKQKGDLEGAARKYEEVLRPIPQYRGIVKLRLGYVYQMLGQYKKAEDMYNIVARTDPTKKESRLARRLFAKIKELRTLEKRKALLEEEISKEASNERLQSLYYELGTVKNSLSDFKAAEEAFRLAVEQDPNTELAKKARFNLGWNYKLQEKDELSEGIFRELAADAEYKLAADSQYWLADSLRNQGKFENALVEFENVAKRFKESVLSSTAIFRTGYTCAYDLKDIDQAKKYFDRLREEYDKAHITGYVQSELLQGLKGIYRDLGFKLLLEGKWDESVQMFKKALNYDSKDARSYSGMGAAKGFLTQWRAATQMAEKGISLAPKDAYAKANLGYIHLLKGDYEAALKPYEEAVRLDANYTEAQYNLGWIYQTKGDYKKAIEVYKNCIDIEPTFAEAHNNLGACYWHLERFDEAGNEFMKAVKIKPDFLEAHFNMGLVHLLKKRYKQAEAEFLKVLTLKPDMAEAIKALEEAQEKLQEIAK